MDPGVPCWYDCYLLSASYNNSTTVKKKSGRRPRRRRARYPKKRLAKKMHWQKLINRKIIGNDHCYFKSEEVNAKHLAQKSISSDHAYLKNEEVYTPASDAEHLKPENQMHWDLIDIKSESNESESPSLQEETVVYWEPSYACDVDDSERTYYLTEPKLTHKVVSNSSFEYVGVEEFPPISENECNRILDREIKTEKMSPGEEDYSKSRGIVGSFHVLNWAMRIQKRHSEMCLFGELKVVKERNVGFVSTITFTCSMCGQSEEHSFDNSDVSASTINCRGGTLSTTDSRTYTDLGTKAKIT